MDVSTLCSFPEVTFVQRHVHPFELKHKSVFNVLGTLRDQQGSIVVLLPLGLLGLALDDFCWRCVLGLPVNTLWRFVLAGSLCIGAAFGLQRRNV